MKRFDVEDFFSFRGYQISEVYGMVKRRKEGGGDIVKHISSMLINDGMMKKEGYNERIVEYTNDSKKRDEMRWLAILYSDVYGMEMKRAERWTHRPVCTGRRMVEVWKDEGKEDSEGRREWERRWREAGDIMNEEDVMETSIMHLCIPDYEQKEEDGLIVSSECSLNALSVLLNERVDRTSLYHFPV